MDKYYIKIKHDNAEIEFSTSDKEAFNKKISDLMQIANNLEDKKLLNTSPSEKHSEVKLDLTPDIPTLKIADIEPNQETNFDKILNKALKNPKEQTLSNMKKDECFLEMLKNKKITNDMDYLLLTAWYLSEKEHLLTFSLKQINKKLVPIIDKALGHALVHEAIQKNYLKIMPNLTNTISLTEYEITKLTEEYVNAL